MNLNDLRAKAYGKSSGNSSGSLIKETNKEKPLFSDVNHEIGEILSSKKNQGKLSSEGLYKVPSPETPQKEEPVYRRVAKFLVLIGVDEASKILPLLTPEQTEKIIPEIATIRNIPEGEAEQILEEFNGLYKTVTERGGKETARAILEKTYGKEKAEEILKKTADFSGNRPFDYLDDAGAEKILRLLSDESEAVQSLVLSNIAPKKAADVINLMKPQEKALVIKRLATMKGVAPEIVDSVDKAMKEKASKIVEEKTENLDGRNALAEILKKMSPEAENSILATLGEEDPELTEDMKSRLFTMDDVIKADERFVQEQLRPMENLDIAKLIAGKPDSFREKILSSVSQARKLQILEEEQIHKPFRKSDCSEITEKFFGILRTAYENGDLEIQGRNDEEYI